MEILVHRPSQYQDKIRDYRLFVDGVFLTKIKPNSQTVLNIPDDAKQLQAKIDWCTSAMFMVNEIKSNRITIKNTYGDHLAKALLMPLYYISLGRKQYLTIESGQ
ncbi:hypothetical protein H8K35_02855 [Undibacterium sp. LX40W]|uniref:Uncharacterized protein n=1 Tax=Undibacterium nitidum TaxID=2762298 RepID=A0A923HV49_9BURK|nr:MULTISPECIES: hypothetical protein [Undibacterium]MBC3880676.1 hypothetical protein [Undibacterium nitidum]MBC3890589.1 hypothetical protein [Undibacterium sp. LX40W]